MDSSKIDLQYIYTDRYENRLQTTVYPNGQMQVSVFISVNYNGTETDSTEQEVITYVQNHAVVYSITESKNVDWPKSTSDNGFQHDVNNAATRGAEKDASRARKPRPEAAKGGSKARKGSPEGRKGRSGAGKGGSARFLSDVRVPLYFTVPQGKSGTYKWIAKLDSDQTSTDSPIEITVKRLEISTASFNIHDIASVDCQILRSLRYTSAELPPGHRLVKPLNYKGHKFSGSGSKCWVSMIRSSSGHKAGCFVEYRQTDLPKVALDDHTYYSDEYESADVTHHYCVTPSEHGWETTTQFKESDVDLAWDQGIAMINVREYGLHLMQNEYPHAKTFNFELGGFRIQDNFGNILKIDINWDKGDWWGMWAVSSVTVENN